MSLIGIIRLSLLLPVVLSCESQSTLLKITYDYRTIVEVEMNNAAIAINSSLQKLQNSTCRELKSKPHSCTMIMGITSKIHNIHNMACKMFSLGHHWTDSLVKSVWSSVGCPCLAKPTRGPMHLSVRRREATRQHSRKTTKKNLCKINLLLKSMRECYYMLNSIHLAAVTPTVQ